MALRRQFAQLITDLRAELGRQTDPAVGVADLPSLKRTLQRNYEFVYDEYDWPHLSIVADRQTVNAGQRHYDFPTDLDFDSIEEVVYWWNGKPKPLLRGIGFEEYGIYDPEADARMDPPERYDVRFVTTKEMMEIWPLPGSQGEMQCRGRKKFVQLVNDADRCLVDDHLVILTSAVELLPRQKSGDVQIKLQALQQRFLRQKALAKSNTQGFRIGGAGASRTPSKAIIRVG